MMVKGLQENKKNSDFYLVLALLSGYISLLITNFFGFSVVPTSVLFYLFPALAIAVKNKGLSSDQKKQSLSTIQITGIAVVSLVALYSLMMLFNYWHADYMYARAQEAQNNEDYTNSLKYYRSAIDLEPNEAVYHAQLGSLYADLTTAKEADATLIQTFTTSSVQEMAMAQKLSPQNVRILKLIANSYATLGDKDPKYLVTTLELTQKLQVFAPTDPSVLYQQCLTFAKLDHFTEALESCETAITMKPDYKIARRLSAYLYEQTKQPEKAKAHLQYILKNISPDDVAVQDELKKLQ
jgi:tetratricopeptide (TPR) repeat protein